MATGARLRYRYLGDRFTDEDLVDAACDPIRRPDGKRIVGRNATMLVVFEDARRAVVLRRRLRLQRKG